ncbi:MAG: hypothetical protein R3D68_04925 [Hyphomicrobiaceae bacterium]
MTPTRTPWPTGKIPRLLRHLGINLGLGAAFAVLFTAGLIRANVAGLGDLIANSAEPALVMILLGFLNILTFGSLAMGISIMTLPWRRDGDPDDEI